MMTILQIIASSKSWAGMEQYAFDLSRGLIARGHRVVFVIADDGEVVAPRFEKIGKVYRLPLRSKFARKSINRLMEIIDTEKPNIIHTHQPKNIFQAHFAKASNKEIRIIHTLHFLINPVAPQWLYSWIFNRTSRIIAVSEQVRQRALEVYPKLNPTKVLTILNSIDTERFDRSSEQAVKSDKVVIGYAGRLVQEKGVAVLIHAVAKLNKRGIPFKLELAGTGEPQYVDSLKAIAKAEGVEQHVEFMGFVTDMGSFISNVDIAVVPSVWREPCSLMLLEYMANGKAIVSTNNGGQPEVIDNNKNGILIDPDNVEALEQSLEQLISNPHLRGELGENAKEKFDLQLSFSNFVDQTIETYTNFNS